MKEQPLRGYIVQIVDVKIPVTEKKKKKKKKKKKEKIGREVSLWNWQDVKIQEFDII